MFPGFSSSRRVQSRSARQRRRSLSARIEQLEPRLTLDSTVVFNEIMYNPVGAAESLEWIELHNQMGVDMDVSRWRLDGGVSFAFPNGTTIPRGGYLVVASDPTALFASTGFASALGPYSGQLSNGGEKLELVNNSNRTMDTVDYRDDEPWPVGPDGSGFTMAKRDPDAASETAENWTTSAQRGGTPGVANFATFDPTPVTTTLIRNDSHWKYDDTATELATAWRDPAFDDAAWPSGAGPLFAGDNTPPPMTPTSLVAYWDFDDNVADHSATTPANNGVAFGSVAYSSDVPGAVGSGKALSITGPNSYVGVAASASLNSSVFTLSYWLKDPGQLSGTGVSSSAGHNRITSRGSDSFETSVSNAPGATLPANSNLKFYASGWTQTSATTSPSQWMHVAYVSTGSTLTQYVNGNPVFSTARTINPSGSFYIGARVNAATPNEGFTGLLDDVAMWNVALPQASIQQLVSGLASPATLVVAAPVDVASSTTTWRISTESVEGGAAGAWDPSGLGDPPAEATFTIVPTATNTGVIPLVNAAATALGVQGLVADNNVRYYRTTFELPPLAAASASIQLAVDNGAAVYINRQLVATETSFSGENWTAPYPSITIAESGAVSVSKFDSQIGTFTGWLSGQNEIIVAVRNPNSEAAPAGALAFKMSVVPTFAAATTQIDLGPTTYYFRNEFDFAGDISRTTLSLSTLVDDGAVYYLNGFEVYRQNMPAGAVTYDTLAATEIGIPAAGSAVAIAADRLQQGSNVLAVEVHQATTGDMDMLFATTLRASTAPVPPDAPLELAFNEVAGAAAGDFWAELANRSGASVNLAGFILASSDQTKTPYVLPSQSIPAGGFLVLSEATIGFDALSGDRLFLYRPEQTSLVDAVVVRNRSRGRSPAHGDAWLYPDVPTPGAANHFSLHDDVVINEIMYHPRPLPGTPDTPATFDETPLVAFDATWKFNRSGANLGATWYQTNHPVGGNWQTGQTLIGVESSNLPVDLRTTWPDYTSAVTTYYYQKEFTVSGTPADAELVMRHIIDDGAIFYLNGVELTDSAGFSTRFGMPAGPVNNATFASTSVDNATYSGFISLDPAMLNVGTNVLSVEVHQINAGSSDTVFGLELLLREELTPFLPGEPFRESNQQWIELFNRSAATIDLTEWELGGGIDFEFAPGTMLAAGEYIVVARDVAALRAANPTINVVGPFSGTLSRAGDRVVLRDAVDNPADEVRFFDSGRWHAYADGGGSSLELIDPDSDNAQAQAWNASDESDAGSWQTVTYRGVAQSSSVGPDGLWQEFLLGLLDAGEVLLDDVRVTQNPSTTPVQLIQNGTFESDVVGSQPAAWRVLGTHGAHGKTVIAVDPDDAANHVLHLVATSASEHIHNHIETTLKNGAAIASISNGTEYEISYRVKHLAGDLQVNTRLYFNRLPKTTILTPPPEGGTPGAVNSRFQANVGPTYADFIHGPAVPPAGSPVTVSATAADPDGVASMALWYSVNNGAWQNASMSLGADGKHVGTIPGQSAGAVVQFYVEGTDGLGAVSTYPADGRDSRALYQVADGRASLGGANDVHNVRLVMTPNDANLLHAPTNAMSNDRIGATVVYDERTIYYDVGVRLKGSERGRRQDVRISFNVEFQPDQLFRGVHDNIAIDRSGAGDQFSQKEIIVEHIVTHAGDIPGEYSDLIRVITPRNTHTGSAMLMMARYGDVFLDSQYDNGGDGTLFEYELIYYPAGTTDGNPESPKLPYPSPDGVVGVSIRDLGDDKENYRWPFLIKNNRDADDYSRLIAMAKTFGTSGASYNAQIDSVVDVDQWLRAFAVGILTGIGDSYFSGAAHNLELYVRPEDQRVLLFPHDMDFSFSAGTGSTLTPNGDLNKMLGIPGNRHHYFGHVHDIVTTTFNSAYMTPWINHYDSLLPAESFGSFISYIGSRSSSALSQINSAIPQVGFAITTNGGNDFSVDAPTATLQGTGWVNVRTIRVSGDNQPLLVTWINDNTWQLTLPVDFGTNAIVLEAYDFQGALIATDSVTVTSTVSFRPLQDFLRVSELMYHPADETAEELAAGFGDADDFEFLEFLNTSTTETLDLSTVKLSQGITFNFASAAIASLAPGQRLVIVEDAEAFAFRYPGVPIAGQYSGRLDNAGELLTIMDGDGAVIQSFTYDDTGEGWHPTTDGIGYSLVIRDPLGPLASWSNGPAWAPSASIGGSPGSEDLLDGDVDGDGSVSLVDLAILQSYFGTNGGATRANGDLDGNGAVNRIDVAIFARNFGRSIASGSPALSAPAAVVQNAVASSRVAPVLTAMQGRPSTAVRAESRSTVTGRLAVAQRSTASARRATNDLQATDVALKALGTARLRARGSASALH